MSPNGINTVVIIFKISFHLPLVGRMVSPSLVEVENIFTYECLILINKIIIKIKIILAHHFSLKKINIKIIKIITIIDIPHFLKKRKKERHLQWKLMRPLFEGFKRRNIKLIIL